MKKFYYDETYNARKYYLNKQGEFNYQDSVFLGLGGIYTDSSISIEKNFQTDNGEMPKFTLENGDSKNFLKMFQKRNVQKIIQYQVKKGFKYHFAILNFYFYYMAQPVIPEDSSIEKVKYIKCYSQFYSSVTNDKKLKDKINQLFLSIQNKEMNKSEKENFIKT